MQKHLTGMKQAHLQCGKYSLSLESPLIMGILNVTPDSFSDGGKFSNFDSAIRQTHAMIENGVDIIDIGGESTRPGADKVSEDEELQRVIPLIEKLSQEIDVPISIDTSKAAVMYEAVNAGASMINDVFALQQAEALSTAAKLNVPVCLMHMQGKPRTMQNTVRYDNVVQDVLNFLQARVQACVNAGIKKSQIIIDPGFGFGKELQHNLSLLNSLSDFVDTAHPVLVGLSRKSLLGQITGRDVHERLIGSLALAQVAVQQGAHILRVHDVGETKDVLMILEALETNSNNLK